MNDNMSLKINFLRIVYYLGFSWIKVQCLQTARQVVNQLSRL